ncbi:MAG: hypothetical protein U9O24_06130, partial [Campylobacterota bacterium]|nr:hypothetical protein [Campylobacterota bacterium]
FSNSLLFYLWLCFSLHFLEKRSKNRRCSRIASLIRSFTTTGTLCVIDVGFFMKKTGLQK